MSACDTLLPRAAFLATLPQHDPELRELDQHARTCVACARALREGQQLAQLLGTASLPAPSAEALHHAAAPVLLRLRLSQALVPAATAVAFGLLVLAARTREPGLPLALLLAVLAVSAGALLRLPRLALGGALLVSAGFAIALGHGMEPLSFTGGQCLLLEQVAALLPFGALVFLRRGGALEFAAAASAGALAGQAALHLTCADHLNATHLLAFHFAGVVVAAAWGAMGGRLLAPRLA